MSCVASKILAVAACAAAVIGVAPAYASVMISKTTAASDQAVFDGSSGAVTLMVIPADLGGALDSVTDVTISIDFMKCGDPFPGTLTTPLPAACPNSDPGFPDEISFKLKNPGGTTLDLILPGTYTNSAEFGRITVNFSDAAADLVGTGGFVGSPPDFAPVGGQFFSSFGGQPAAGGWELDIENTGGGSPLGFASFTLNITVAEPSASAPEPAPLALLAFGLAVLGVRRRLSRSVTLA